MDIKRPEPHIKLPENAKRVFRGKIFDVYQWEQTLYDGTSATFERLKRPDTASIIPVLEDGRILLIDEEQPGIMRGVTCIAGRMEEGEEPIEAAKRELLEETGYASNEWTLWSAEQPVSKIDWAWYTLVAKGAKKIQDQHLDAGEKIQLKPVSFDEFVALATEKGFLGGIAQKMVVEASIDEEKKETLRKFLGV